MKKTDDWNHYSYIYGEQKTATIRFDVMSAVMSGSGGTGIRLRFSAEASEDSLLSVLSAHPGLWVGRLAYSDSVEWVGQCDEPLPTHLVESLSARGATLEHTPGWDYFLDRVCPTPADWRRIEDREALQRLDLDENGSLQVLHRFVGPESALERVEERLAAEGFAPIHTESGKRTLSHTHPIGDISRITTGLLRLCDPLGVAYDGWALPG